MPVQLRSKKVVARKPQFMFVYAVRADIWELHSLLWINLKQPKTG